MFLTADMGGSRTRIASSTDLKTIHKIEKFSTAKNLEEQQVLINTAIEAVCEGESIDAFCLGVPGIVDANTQRFNTIPNIKYLSNVPIRQLITSDKVSSDTLIGVNDAALSGLGEAVFGNGQDFQTIAYITISTGVGGVKISNKSLDLEQKYFEPGHQIIQIDGREDTKIGTKGTLEAYTSGEAFTRNYKIAPQDCNDPTIWGEYGTYLAAGLFNILALWAPDAIVIGGGVANHFDKFEHAMNRFFETNNFFGQPIIKQAKLLDESGIYGGLALMKQLGWL